MHPFLAQSADVAWYAARGIAVTAFSPLGSPDRPARLVTAGDPAPLFDERVAAIATKHNKLPAQVLIRWAIQRGVVAIPKSVTPARIAQNIDVWDFSLDQTDMATLADLDEGRRIFRGDPWLREGEQWESLWDADFLKKDD